MPGPLLILAGAQALKLGSNLLAARSAKKRRDKITKQRLDALRPAEDRFTQARIGPSQSEGSILQAITQRTLMSLAQRGVLQGSGAASEVAGAIAPAEAERQQQLDDMAFRLSAIKQSIYADGDVPGLGDAFAQTLGSAGGMLAYAGGRQLGAGKAAGGGGANLGAPVEGVDMNLRELDPSAYDPNDPLAAAVKGRTKGRGGYG